MLAVNSEPFDSPDFLYEIKWDGYRCLAYLENNTTVLRSRNLLDITPTFPELAGLHHYVKAGQALLDGEIVIFKEGLPSFAALQARGLATGPAKINRRAQEAPAFFIAFDLLYLKGVPHLREPLEKRKQLLADAAIAGGPLVISEFVLERGRDFFRACAEKGLEGVMAKRLGSPYLPGKRSPHWQKFRHTKEAELIICGYQKGRGGRKLGALILGEKTGQKLIYRGKVGTGFDCREEEQLLKLLTLLEVNNPPLHFPAEKKQNVHWVKPALFCSVSYLGLTEDGLLRHPLYRGISLDKFLK